MTDRKKKKKDRMVWGGQVGQRHKDGGGGYSAGGRRGGRWGYLLEGAWVHCGPKLGSAGLVLTCALSPQYMGCIEVLRSMRSLDFSTRTQVTR